MKVLQIMATSQGGAGIATSRLNSGLHSLGVSSSIISKPIIEDRAYKQIIRLIQEKLEVIFQPSIFKKNDLEILHTNGAFYKFEYKLLYNCDLINLHWVNTLIDFKKFFSLSNLPPIVWTLHDMNTFLGLAHYQNDADLLRQILADGKSLTDSSCRDIDYKTWKQKRELLTSFSKEKLHIVCPSKWLAKEAKKSFLNQFEISVIPNGLDTTLFRPLDTNFAKELLGLPQNNKKIILFVAEKITNFRKGFDILLKGLSLLAKPEEYKLLIMGKSLEQDIQDFDILHLGYISDDRLKACVYSAVDLFIIPTREDNLPNTVLESIACGTPVLGSNVGGIPDMVRPGVTGDLFEVGNSKQLAKKIDAWFERNDLDQISKNCREIAVKEYDLSIQANKYLKIYKKLLLT